ncbi:MAG: hypothetical protein WAN11_10695 [Syntrophobacteraceae bacterium]
MHRKNGTLLIFFMILGLAAATASVCLAATQQVHGWHMGTGWQQTSFSASGVVDTNGAPSESTSNSTFTVTLNGTSRLLSKYYGQQVTFTLSADTKVAVLINGGMGYSTMMVNPTYMMSNSSSGGGGMMGGSGMMSGGTSGGTISGSMGNSLGGSLTLADVKDGDNVQLLGYQDTTTGNFVVTLILVWLY